MNAGHPARRYPPDAHKERLARIEAHQERVGAELARRGEGPRSKHRSKRPRCSGCECELRSNGGDELCARCRELLG